MMTPANRVHVSTLQTHYCDGAHKQAALGGAHTLLLATRAQTAPAHIADNSFNQNANSAYKTVGCPWGSESVVVAFGYGANGQCGTGMYEQNGLLPLRVRFDAATPLITSEWHAYNAISACAYNSVAAATASRTYASGFSLHAVCFYKFEVTCCAQVYEPQMVCILYAWMLATHKFATFHLLNNTCSMRAECTCRITECTTGIAAGKCSSLACSIQGDMYAWGKAWHGELGTSTNRCLKYLH
jgi:hypothetical protein